MSVANKKGDPVLKTHYGWNATPRLDDGVLYGGMVAIPLVHSGDAMVSVDNANNLDAQMAGLFSTAWEVTGEEEAETYGKLQKTPCFAGFVSLIKSLQSAGKKTPRFVYVPWLPNSGWSSVAKEYLYLLAENGLITQEMLECAVTPMRSKRRSAALMGNPRRLYQALVLMRCVQEYRPVVMMSVVLHASGVPFDIALAYALLSITQPSGHIHFSRSYRGRLVPQHLETLCHRDVQMGVRMHELPHLLVTDAVFKKPELFHHLSELRHIREALTRPFVLENDGLLVSYRQPAYGPDGWDKIAPLVAQKALGNLSLAEATAPDFVKELESARQEDGGHCVDEASIMRMYQALEDNRTTAAALAKDSIGQLQTVFAEHIEDLMNGAVFDEFEHSLPPKEEEV